MHGHALRCERGFTLVEVSAAMAILLVGVLGVLSMANGANLTTSETKAHEAANGLTRDMVEATRALSYAELSGAALTSTLQARPQLADARADLLGWQVARRGTLYTVSTTVCVVDDPKDGLGARDATFCPSAVAAGTADTTPADYKRVTFDLTWTTQRRTERVRHATLVMNSNRGPAIASIATNPPGTTVVSSGGSLAFTVATSGQLSRLEWYLDGAYRQDLASGITGSGTTYAFSWALGTACTAGATTDGIYVVGAKAFGSTGSSPGSRSLTVRLNRCAPVAPAALSGGRNRWGVELRWEDNREDDVVGYRIYRGIGSATPTAIASGPCSGVVKAATCIEPDAASTQTLVYNVRAVDRDSAGALRDGPPTSNISVVTGNRAPATPVIGSAGTYGTIGWYVVTDPDKGDSVDFYRIYRDGQTLAHRYDAIDAVGDPTVWSDDSTGGVAHTYYVVAVDTRLAESGFSNATTR